jgi:putative FmdB family regulatory protein
MPVYEYECFVHGEFELSRPLSECREEQPCPKCGAASRRVLATPPGLARMPQPSRKAHAINEASRHAPKTSADFQKQGPGCYGCKPRSSEKMARNGDSEARGFPSRRPWMISH